MIDKNIEQFMADMGIDSYDDIGFLYQDYIQECSDLLKDVDASLKTTDIHSLEQQIHNLKGVSANLYVQPVFKKAEALNTYLKDHIEMESVDTFIQSTWYQLKEIYDQATSEIVTFFANHQVHLTK